MVKARSIKLRGLTEEETRSLFPESGMILLAYRGSIAHGTYVPQESPDSIDDKDLMGVFVAPWQHYVGFGCKDVKEKIYKEWDCVSYEVRKLISLLLKGNPNVLSLLWVDERHIAFQHSLGEMLRENRSIFVSKKPYHSFSGYAYSQLKRMTHYKFEGYMGEKRKSLVERHGYDTKNAAHLIRLLRMAIEFLVEGRLYVHRRDAAELLAIKRGEWELEKVKSVAEDLFKLADEAYSRSSLPNEPDRKAAEELCAFIIRSYRDLSRPEVEFREKTA